MKLGKAVRNTAIAVLLAVLAAGLWFTYAPRHTPAGQVSLTEVHDIDAFRRWFNDSASHIRAVVLLSPT